MQTDTDRVIQTSETEIFAILARYAAHIPIVIVGTKKDKFLDQQESVARRKLAQTTPTATDMDNQSFILANKDLQARKLALRKELSKVPDLEIDSVQFVYVSKCK